MFWWLIEKLKLFVRALVSQWGKVFPSDDCTLGWYPNPLAPVFYGYRDYNASVRAPGNLRVFYPTLDGSPEGADIFRGCGRYPLILFAHGDCSESEHYKKWLVLPAKLARCGYVVVVPEIPNSSTHPSGNEAAMNRISDVIVWMRQGWEFREAIQPARTGVMGHSFGGVLAARYAAGSYTDVVGTLGFGSGTVRPRKYTVQAYASLDGVHLDWSGTDFPVQQLKMPKLLCHGTEHISVNSSPLWAGISTPKHRAVFDRAEHWDFLTPGWSSCAGTSGPCSLTDDLSIDLVTMFFAKYLPPEKAPNLPSLIGDSLVPPPLNLTFEQEFYAGNHLDSFHNLKPGSGCRLNLEWKTSSTEGGITLP